jgi:hypothetical protein
MLDRDAIKVRLEATRDATSRSRFALLATTVASVSFLVTEFNAYISWNRDFVLSPKLADNNSPTGFAQRRLLDDWVSSSSMNVSLFGIHVNAADLTILGGVALMFLTLWFYYAMRRENRLVGTLLRNTRDASLELMDLVYSGIVSYMVFTAVQPGKPPINTLAEYKPPESIRRQFFGVQLLFLLPVLTLFISLTFDLLSIYLLAAPFREDHQIPPLQGADLAKFVVYCAVGLLCAAITAFNSFRIRSLDRATGEVLRAYKFLWRDKRDVANQLRESHEDERVAKVAADSSGVSGEVRVGTSRLPMVQLGLANAPAWDKLRAHRDTVERKYIGEIGWNDAKRTLTVLGPKGLSQDEQVQYVIRELFRLRRLVDGALTAPT